MWKPVPIHSSLTGKALANTGLGLFQASVSVPIYTVGSEGALLYGKQEVVVHLCTTASPIEVGNVHRGGGESKTKKLEDS